MLILFLVFHRSQKICFVWYIFIYHTRLNPKNSKFYNIIDNFSLFVKFQSIRNSIEIIIFFFETRISSYPLRKLLKFKLLLFTHFLYTVIQKKSSKILKLLEPSPNTKSYKLYASIWLKSVKIFLKIAVRYYIDVSTFGIFRQLSMIDRSRCNVHPVPVRKLFHA